MQIKRIKLDFVLEKGIQIQNQVNFFCKQMNKEKVDTEVMEKIKVQNKDTLEKFFEYYTEIAEFIKSLDDPLDKKILAMRYLALHRLDDIAKQIETPISVVGQRIEKVLDTLGGED